MLEMAFFVRTPLSRGELDMEAVGMLALFGGLLLAIVVQIRIVVLAFKRNLIQGLCCIFVPAYILFFAMREETRQPRLLLLWAVGLVVFVIGVGLLS